MPDIEKKQRREKKIRKQHFVWDYYLRGWSDNGQIHLLRENIIHRVSTEDVAQKRDFYRLKELTQYEIDLIAACINTFPLECRSAQFKLLEMFCRPYKELALVDELIGLLGGVRVDELEEVKLDIDVTLNNLEEELHGSVEGRSTKFIEAARIGQIDFWTDPMEKQKFIHFLSLQMMRTRKVQEDLSALIAMNLPNQPGGSNVWGVMKHIIAINISRGIFLDESYGLRVIYNRSSLPFITSDQPVVNVHGHGLALEKTPDEFEVYYPISPVMALTMGKFPSGRVDFDEAEVKEKNDLLFDMSHQQVFSIREDVLERYRI